MSDTVELAQKIRDLEHWKNGDGAIGAERRLQIVEERSQNIERNCCADLCQENAAELEDLQHRIIEAEHAQEGFVTTETMNEMMDKAKQGFIQALRSERKRATEIFKALAPYFVAVLGFLAAFFVR